MRSPPLAIFLSLLPSIASSRSHHALPEDTYAFPKHRVSCLRPVFNQTAQRWLKDGLNGGELEFIDQPWKEEPGNSVPLTGAIDGGDELTASPQVFSYRFHLNLTFSHFLSAVW